MDFFHGFSDPSLFSSQQVGTETAPEILTLSLHVLFTLDMTLLRTRRDEGTEKQFLWSLRALKNFFIGTKNMSGEILEFLWF